MKSHLLYLLILISSLNAYSQTSQWDFLMVPKGDLNLNSLRSMDLNKSGIILAGTFKSNIEFNGSQLSNSNGDGIYVAHYDSLGSPLSIARIGESNGLGGTHTIAVSLDYDKSYFIGVRFADSLFLGSVKFFSHGETDFVIARYNASDSLLWYKQIGLTDIDGISGLPRTILIDTNHNLLVTGLLSGTQTIDTFNFASTSRDAFLLKLDSLGNVKLLKGFGSNYGWDVGTGITLDKNSNIFSIASFERTNNILIDTIQVYGSNEYVHGLILILSKWDPNGKVQWLRHMGSQTSGGDIGARVVKTDSKGNVYIAGFCHFASSLDWVKIQGGGLYDGHGLDVFIVKYDKDGNFKWFQKSNSINEEYFAGFDISENDELYLSFSYTTSGGFDNSELHSQGGQDIGLAKFDTLGNLQWLTSIGGNDFDENVSLLCSDTMVYLLGQSMSTPCHFNQTDHTTQAPSNLFLARLNKYKQWPVEVQESQWQGLTLYPNPSQGTSTLTLPHAMQGTYMLSDVAGRQVMSQILHPTKTKYTIPTSSLHSGLYLLHLETPQGRHTEKLVLK